HFFFSSRRRHTRFKCDWSSDVCSSDLGLRDEARGLARTNLAAFGNDDTPIVVNSAGCGAMLKEYGHLVDVPEEGQRFAARVRDRSEERRVGKEGRVRGGAEQ